MPNVRDLCRGEDRGAPISIEGPLRGPPGAPHAATGAGSLEISPGDRTGFAVVSPPSPAPWGSPEAPRGQDSRAPFERLNCPACGGPLGALDFVPLGAPEFSFMKDCSYGGRLFTLEAKAGDMLLLF